MSDNGPFPILFPKLKYTTILNLAQVNFSPAGEIDEAVNRMLDDRLRQQLYSQSFGSTMPVAQTTMTEANLRDALEEMERHLKQIDPLLQRGIERDWICVVHPRLVQSLIESLKDSPFVPLPDEPQTLVLERVTRRTTRIQNSAPQDAIEYMPMLSYLAKYKEEILAGWAIHRLVKEGEARARRHKEFGSDDGL